ncbi:MAG: RidA family protein [Deltaproteobacteria bacterium]|nr:RidA family protein [Deltaproteobacteria bacterium]
MDFEKQITDLKLAIPSLSPPIGSYVPAVKTGNLVYTSGQLPLSDGRLLFKGRVGKEVSLENAQRSAKAALINALAAIKWLIGDLNRIKKIIRLNGHVNSAIGFLDQPKVLNAASELLLQIFGDAVGSHSRAAIGVLELPMGACIELDLIVEIK